jgi:hypothetical protein
MIKRYLLFIFLIYCIYDKAQAQDKVATLSLELKNANVQQFVNAVESTSHYHLYYIPAQFDSLRITLSVKDKPLKFVLEQVFTNTNYHFAFHQNSVFLTKEKEILTYLPSDQNNSTIKPSAIADLNEKSLAPIISAIENKTYEIGPKTNQVQTGTATLTGYIKNFKNGEPIANVNIYVEGTDIKAISNQYGFYSLTLPKGHHVLNIREASVKDVKREIMLYTNGKMDIDLQDQLFSLKEVKISATKAANVNSVQAGVEKLTIKDIRQIPTAFGEADILKAILTLPGVKSAGEASGGFNVRGGAIDQNLILFNDATIYNPNHFFGFFSAFNPDVVKDVQLYKSDIAPKYGGRLSSVLEVTTRDGNKKEFTGSAGIGLLTSRINLEGPIVKDKTSFIFGARTTYSDWLLKALPVNSSYKNAKASFYDVNLNINHEISTSNNLYFTGYISHDQSNLGSDTTYSYANKNLSVKWRHTYSGKLNSVFTTGVDRYEYENYSAHSIPNAYKLNFDINQTYAKLDFNHFVNNNNTLSYGLSSIYYKIHPGSYNPLNGQSLVMPNTVPAEQALESALYFGDKFDVNSKLSFNAGIRYSLFNSLGPATVDTYAPGLPKNENNVTGSTTYGSGKITKTYGGPELRLSGRYIIAEDLSIKGGYNASRQYINLLTNSSSVSPTDIWKLSDPNIKPQYGQQVSLGLYKNFSSNTIETSIEGYYKKIQDYLDYKSGATLILNHNIERDVVETHGKAYGVEFMIRKTTGALNGWLSYTYSRTFLQTDATSGEESINEGRFYEATVDQPHAFDLVGNYRLSHRFSISLNTTYNTGRPITLPVLKYNYEGSERVLYSDRNQYRIPDYFRTDFSLNLDGNSNLKQLFHSSWTFGIYNLTGRKNAYSNYYVTENGQINGYKLIIFGSPIPFINYNIKFR